MVILGALAEMRRPLSFILPAFAFLTACQPERGASLAEAERHYAEGQWGDARIDLMNVLKTDPENIDALRLMARIQVAGGDGEGAAATLARIGDKAVLPELADMRAEADMLRGRCRDLLAEAPGKTAMSATLRRVRALCVIDGGDTAAATKEIAAGLADHSGDAGLQLVAARLALLRGDFYETGRLVDAVRKAKGDGYEVEMVAGAIEQRRANVSGALAHYAAAEKHNPLNSGPLAAQAELFAAVKGKDALAQVVDRMRRIAPQSPATAIVAGALILAATIRPNRMSEPAMTTST